MPATLRDQVGSILLIDDNAVTLSTFKRAFEAKDWDVFTASQRAAAIDLASRNRPSVVWLDLQLVDEWGMDLIEPILDVSPSSSIVIVTAHGDVEKTNEALQRGAKALLEKPQSPEQVLDALELARQRMERRALVAKPLVQGEREAITTALRETEGNKAAAARKLGITVRSLRRKMQRLEAVPKK